MHRRPVWAPHRESRPVAILVSRTRRELRNAIARHGVPVIEGGGILGRSPAEVHGRRCPWAHVSRRHRVVWRSLHSRVLRGPGLVAAAHVAGGAEREVDVPAAGANPVVVTAATVGARALPGRLAPVIHLRRHCWWRTGDSHR